MVRGLVVDKKRGEHPEDGPAQVRQGGAPRVPRARRGHAAEDVLRHREGGSVRRRELRQRGHAVRARGDLFVLPARRITRRDERNGPVASVYGEGVRRDLRRDPRERGLVSQGRDAEARGRERPGGVHSRRRRARAHAPVAESLREKSFPAHELAVGLHERRDELPVHRDGRRGQERGVAGLVRRRRHRELQAGFFRERTRRHLRSRSRHEVRFLLRRAGPQGSAW